MKLIETRWVGHLRASNSIFENYEYIINTLPEITGANNLDGDDVALATGLFRVMSSINFIFVLIFMKDLLQTIEPVSTALQGREIGYKDSMALIKAVYKTIGKMRSDDNFKKYDSQAANLFKKLKLTESAQPKRPVRNRHQSSMLKDSVVEETLGERSEPAVTLKSTFNETFDIVLTEMNNRFEKHDNFLTAIATADEMDLKKLQPLAELGIKLPSEIQLAIAKQYMEDIRERNEEMKNLKNPKDKKIKTHTLTELYKVRTGMEDVYKLFATIETFPSGTAACESSFSALTRDHNEYPCRQNG